MQTFRSCVKMIFARIFLDLIKLPIDFNTGMKSVFVKSADVANEVENWIKIQKWS